MVKTRRLTSGGQVDTSNPTSPIPISDDNVHKSAKVSRALRKLQIDGNAALHGIPSLKRKRGQDVASTAGVLTPPRSHSVSSQRNSPHLDRADTILPGPRPTIRTSLQRISVPDQEDVIHVSTSRRTQTPPAQSLKPGATVEDTSPADEDSHDEGLNAQAPGTEQYWFLPDGALLASESEVEVNDNEETAEQQARQAVKSRASDTERGAVDSINTRPTSSIIRQTVSTEQLPAEKESVDQDASPHASTKVERELRKLEIRANPALNLKYSPAEEPLATARGKGRAARRVSTDIIVSEKDEDPEDVSSAPVPEKASKKLSREMRKLEIHANERLGGQTRNPTGQVYNPLKRVQRRQKPDGRGTPRSARALQQNRSTAPKLSTTRAQGPIEAFPKDPPPELVDHILFLLADAAEERELVCALQGTAQDAIARDVRWEAPNDLEDRVKGELDIMESWEPLDEGTMKMLEQSGVQAGPLVRSSVAQPRAVLRDHQCDEVDLDHATPRSSADLDAAAVESNIASNIIVNLDQNQLEADDTQELLDVEDDDDDDISDGLLPDGSSDQISEADTQPSSAVHRKKASMQPISRIMEPDDANELATRRWKGKGRADHYSPIALDKDIGT
ncbi:hypothetical protein C1H76_1644 [Elsinoe australis]|uniref:Uncharacterized protein n=1 Tax=Elsinoe australis TaxID=40998 RepID=A0A4U7B400_9PEZI|nr:hypothetical protein C1H76_1644 [Elsinoe australis]